MWCITKKIWHLKIKVIPVTSKQCTLNLCSKNKSLEAFQDPLGSQEANKMTETRIVSYLYLCYKSASKAISKIVVAGSSFITWLIILHSLPFFIRFVRRMNVLHWIGHVDWEPECDAPFAACPLNIPKHLLWSAEMWCLRSYSYGLDASFFNCVRYTRK